MADNESSTEGAWTVGTSLSVGTTSTLTGNVTCSANVSAGTGTAGYTTDGNYNFFFTDGDGVKFDAIAMRDVGAGLAYYRVYLRNGSFEAEEM